MNFKTAVSSLPSAKRKTLPLAELEALACALLTVLLALFGARITRDHALGLQLGAEFSIEQHESARNTQANRVGLSSDSAAAHIRQNIEVGRGVGRDQRPFRGDALRGRHKVFVERLAVDLELTAARTKKNASDRRLAASGSVVLNSFCHLSI